MNIVHCVAELSHGSDPASRVTRSKQLGKAGVSKDKEKETVGHNKGKVCNVQKDVDNTKSTSDGLSVRKLRSRSKAAQQVEEQSVGAASNVDTLMQMREERIRRQKVQRQLFVDKHIKRLIDAPGIVVTNIDKGGQQVSSIGSEPEWGDDMVLGDVYDFKTEEEIILATLGACYGALGAEVDEFPGKYCFFSLILFMITIKILLKIINLFMYTTSF